MACLEDVGARALACLEDVGVERALACLEHLAHSGISNS